MLSVSEDSSDVRLGSSLFPAMLASVRGLINAARKRPLLQRRPFGVRESESAMQFADFGSLACVCGYPDAGDERQDLVCQTCGHAVTTTSAEALNRHLTPEEIRDMVWQLQATGIRSRNYDVPDHVATLSEMNDFLALERAKPRKHRRKKKRSEALLRAQALLRAKMD